MAKELLDNEKFYPAVIFLVVNDGKLLLERRVDPESHYYNRVFIPGGKVEEGEKAIDALSRELDEELGIIRRVTVDLGSFKNISLGGKSYIFHAFLITAYDKEVVNKEPAKSEHMWVLPDEAAQLFDFATSTLVLERAKTFI